MQKNMAGEYHQGHILTSTLSGGPAMHCLFNSCQRLLNMRTCMRVAVACLQAKLKDNPAAGVLAAASSNISGVAVLKDVKLRVTPGHHTVLITAPDAKNITPAHVLVAVRTCIIGETTTPSGDACDACAPGTYRCVSKRSKQACCAHSHCSFTSGASLTCAQAALVTYFEVAALQLLLLHACDASAWIHPTSPATAVPTLPYARVVLWLCPRLASGPRPRCPPKCTRKCPIWLTCQSTAVDC